MAQVINTNSLSLITQNNINKNQSALSSSIERLSSGLRINSAKDDAAGQAIANRFTSNINGLTQAARNANDGISLAQTTEGALSEINNNLQRVRELTVQAQNGTNSDSDLASIQDEITSRLDEIDRVSGQTQFNGVSVLSKADNSMSIQVGANDGQTISINLQKIDSSTLGLSGFNVQKPTTVSATKVTGLTYSDTTTAIKTGSANTTALTAGTGGTLTVSGVSFDKDTGKYYAAVNDTASTGSISGTYEATVGSDGSVTVSATSATPTGATTATFVKQSSGNAIDLTKAATTLTGAGVTLANGAKDLTLVKLTGTDTNGNTSNAGYALQAADGKLYATDYDGTNGTTLDAKTISYTSSLGAPSNAAVELGGIDGHTEIATIDSKTYLASKASKHDFSDTSNPLAEASATTTADPLKALDAAIAQVDKFRSSLGAVQNRLDSAVTNLNNTTTNLSEAQSRIQDADYATEVSNMSKAQIIQQAGNSVLAKANQVPQQVLSLLQG
ncbi:flagellin N-terminal helical domain-containing protein [Pantoea piersonii]|uniref:flagellin N-terminal helical domain-containing protein n=1 Tax=Pantoea piersonii TaxID=2364647 RepID=UPI00289E28BA|nr:flagellin [Pantoea piersonii]